MKKSTVILFMIFLFMIFLLVYAGCGKQVKESFKADSKIVEIQKVKEDEVDQYLQVPSPDWRDQIIYFVMTDRFEDGDPSNNDQGAGEYNPEQNRYYSGGDLKGVLERLDYIKGLGATAVWITPPVANQWWDPWVQYSGYHGYWAENFMEVDKHYGTLEDYKLLSATLHKNDMYLIQDIVCNHTGNFFRYQGEYNPDEVTENFELNQNSTPVSAPSQYPFSMNNAENPEHLKTGIYNWTPKVLDYQNQSQLLTYQMSGLDDINTKNPIVRGAMRESYNYWIKEAGVDGYRIDTVVYVDHEFWHDFIHSDDLEHPGIEKYAETLGKDQFYTFGETWVNVTPESPDGDLAASRFQGTEQKPEMTSVLNFPMHIDLLRVFSEGKPTSYLTYRLKSAEENYRNHHLLLNFIDNHDMNRFLTSNDKNSLKQALMFIMTIPGVPVIYYGTEQEFTETRGSMFKEGFGSGGEDHFDTESEMYEYIRNAVSLRKEYAVFRRGSLTVLKDAPYGAGVLAYQMEYQGKKAVVIFNTSEVKMIVDNMETGLEEGTVLKPLMTTIRRSGKRLTVGKNGRLNMKISPKTGYVYLADEAAGKAEVWKPSVRLEIKDFQSGVELSKNIEISGTAEGTEELSLVIDGDYINSVSAETENGKWTAVLPVEDLENGVHHLVAYAQDGSGFALSESYTFVTAVEYVKIAEIDDPVGDDHGPEGNYLYPVDETFNHQMDIEKAVLYQGGKNLKLSIKMADEISEIWNPKYGFDHVSYSIYIDTPGNETGREPAEKLPRQNAVMKDGLKWDYMMLLGGWMSFIYSSKNASAENYGTPVSPSPKIIVNRDERIIDVMISGKSIGSPEEMKGMKFYVTTWDYDGLESSFRLIEPEPQPFIFGGGKDGDPLIMDDTELLIIE